MSGLLRARDGDRAAREIVRVKVDRLRRSKSSDGGLRLGLLGLTQLSDPGNRKARLFSAAGSANETLTGLRIAIAWRHLPAQQAQEALALARRIVAILWKMTRG